MAEWLHAGAEPGVGLGLEGWEPRLVRWKDTRTPGGLLEGLTGGWYEVIFLMGTRGWYEVRYQDAHLHATA